MKKYVEFNKHEYYGLVTVETENNFFFEEAVGVYVDEIAGESAEEILKEADPREVTEEYAFWKLANCKYSGDYTVKGLLAEFNRRENTTIVIDGSLV